MQVLCISILHSMTKIGAKAKSRVTLVHCGGVGGGIAFCASLQHDIVGYTCQCLRDF